MDAVVHAALEAMARRDWVQLRLLLHPYVRWTDADGQRRGRTNVLDHLAGAPPPSAPAAYELRDGQIYRWTANRSEHVT